MVARTIRRLVAVCGLLAVLVSSLESLTDRARFDALPVVTAAAGTTSVPAGVPDACGCLCRCACAGTASAVVVSVATATGPGGDSPAYSTPAALRGIAAPSPEGPPPRV